MLHMKKTSILAIALLVVGCGSTGPENVVSFSGTVVAGADGAGYTQGQAIDGALITLRYQPPLEPSSQIRDTDESDASGAWSVQSGPPRGQADPDCATLSISVVKAGFLSATVRLSSFCGTGPDRVTGVEVELTPS